MLVAVFAYSLQLYYDFSGYTDIARGAGQLLGVKLPINFDRPYLSMDIAEFWRRWHISFSNWLRDYIFYSLPGKRYQGDAVSQSGGHHGARRTVARRQLELRHLGHCCTARRWRSCAAGRPGADDGNRPSHGTSRLRRSRRHISLSASPGSSFARPRSIRREHIAPDRVAVTFSTANLSPAIGGVLLVAVAGCLVTKKMYATAIDFFSARPVLVHAVALALIAIAIESLGGRGSAPFVYSRF